MGDLAILLSAASEGERSAVLEFLRAFQNANLIVPEKIQSPPFQNLPAYPDRPLNILALPDDKIVVVPVFSDNSKLKLWNEAAIKVRTIKSLELIKLLPEDWWLALNPGDEIRKDFSPWELKRLLGGDEELAEIATDLEQAHGVEPLTIRKLASEEYQEVRTLLQTLKLENGEIREVFVAIEEAQTYEGSPVETLLVGVKTKDLEPAQAEQIRTKVKYAVSPLLIGTIQLRVLLGVGFSDLELGVFADIPAESIEKINT